MPDADFCSAVRRPRGRLSRLRDTEQISWGKLSRLSCTIAESTLRTLMDTDFAVSCPLVRCWRLVSGFCPSIRTFDPCFLRTPSRDGSPCIITRPSPPSGWPEDFHLQAAEHAQHTTKPPRAAGSTSPPPFSGSDKPPSELHPSCCKASSIETRREESNAKTKGSATWLEGRGSRARSVRRTADLPRRVYARLGDIRDDGE
jgi:hypothetical protein